MTRIDTYNSILLFFFKSPLLPRWVMCQIYVYMSSLPSPFLIFFFALLSKHKTSELYHYLLIFFLTTALTMRTKHTKTIIGVAVICFSKAIVAYFHVNFYSDTQCQSYSSSLDVYTTSQQCYNYDVNWLHSILVADCYGNNEVQNACCCFWYTEPDCRGQAYDAQNWDGATKCIGSDSGFQSYNCDWGLCYH